MLLLCSGTVVFNIKYNSIFIPLWCLLAFMTNMLYNNMKGVKLPNRRRLILLITLIILNSLFHLFDGIAMNGVAQILFYILGTEFVCSSMSFQQFKKYYVDIVSIMSVFALGVLALVNNGYIGYTKEKVNSGYYLLSFLHVVGWDDNLFNNRLCGMYHEPGMFQIILNIALLYIINDFIMIVNFRVQRKRILQLLCIVFALFSTRSTTGYLVSGTILIIFLIYKRNSIKNIWLKSLYWLSFPGFIFILWKILSSDVILNKFSKDNISFSIRMNDLISGIKLALAKPLWGFGYNSTLYTNVANSLDIDGTSNGFLEITAMMGFPLIVVFLIVLYINAKRNSWNINALLIMIIYLLESFTESWFFFPASLIFYFSFRQNSITGNANGD